MRKHKRLRSGYRSGTKKKSKKKLILRILFVIACVLVLTALAVLLGRHLNEKAKHAETLPFFESDTDVGSDVTAELFPDGIPSNTDVSELEVFAADVDITSGTDKEICAAIDLLSDKYNTVSVRITRDGKLVYTSRALMASIGMTPDNSSETTDDKGSSDTFDCLKAAAQMSHAEGKRLSAVYTAGDGVLGDGDEAVVAMSKEKLIVGELADLGFDEIIIDGLADDSDEITGEKLASVVSYLAALRSVSGNMAIGVTLPSSVYLVSQNASKIKTLSEYADFPAINVSVDTDDPDVAYAYVYDNCYSLKGNFSIYNIRGIITNSDKDVADAVNTALRDLSIRSTQFSVYVEDPSYAPDRGPSDTSKETVEIVSNDDAMRSDDYEAMGTEEPEN